MVIPIVALGSNPSKNTGGPSRIGYEIMRYFIAKGNEVTFLDFSNAKVYNLASVDDLENISHKDGSMFLSLLHRIKSSLAQVSPWALDIARIARHRVIGQRVSYYLRDLDHKLVHIHGIGPTLAFAAFGNARIVWSEHSKGSLLRELEMLYGKPPTGLFSTAMRTAYHRLLSESAAITFPSWSALQLFEEYTGWSVPRDKLTIVYNGILDPTQQYGGLENAEPEEGLVVTVAQHVPEKGLDLALQALAKSTKRWRWLVIGETTSWTNNLRNQIEMLGSQVSVEFLGQQSHEQTLRLMQRAHVILATQRVAVFDLAILEAMALSKPVIATRIGGNVEALGDDYPFMGDSIDDIADLLDLVYESPAGVQEVGRRNRERFLARFTLEAMVNSYVEVYQKVSKG